MLSGWNSMSAPSSGFPSKVTRPLTGASSGPLLPQPVISKRKAPKYIRQNDSLQNTTALMFSPFSIVPRDLVENESTGS